LIKAHSMNAMHLAVFVHKTLMKFVRSKNIFLECKKI